MESLQDVLDILIRQKAQIRTSGLDILGLWLKFLSRLMKIDLLTSENQSISFQS
jgi:hypothetical protein